MKIIFFGTPEFVLPTLKTLYETKGVELAAVVTQKDKPVGRNKSITPPPVKVMAENFGIKVIQNLEELDGITADFYVVMAYGEILNKKVLEKPKFGAINVHASLLPKYRGASPIQESLLNGDTETGISIMKMDEKLDHGDLYLLKRIPISKDDNQDSLRKKISELTAAILPLLLEDISKDRLRPIPQNHEKASFCRKIKKTDGKIDWNKSAEEINNMIRAYNPWPIAYTEIKGKKLQILKASVGSENSEPGKFIAEKSSLKIGTGKGTLLPEIVQMEGKKEMKITDFLNGNRNLFV